MKPIIQLLLVLCFIFFGLVTDTVLGQSRGGRRKKVVEQKTVAARNFVTISKETTVITKPLDKDGYPDYLRALNERMKPEGVTPENNAAVLLFKAFGPNTKYDDDPIWPKKYAKALDIQPLPKDGEYFMSFDDYADPSPIGMLYIGEPTEERDIKNCIRDEIEDASKFPWRNSDHPHVLAWLKRNEKPMQVVHEALKRTHFYDPGVTSAEDGEKDFLMWVSIEPCNKYRQFSKLLQARTMHRIGTSRIDLALEDITDCHKLAALCHQKPTLLEHLFGIDIEQRALEAECALAFYAPLSSNELLEHRIRVEQLPPIPGIHDALNCSNRMLVIQAFLFMANRREEVNDYSVPVRRLSIGEFLDWNRILIDWDIVLKTANGWFDRAAPLTKLPRQKRIQAFAPFEEDLNKTNEDFRAKKEWKDLLWKGKAHRSEYLGNGLAAMLFPDIFSNLAGIDRTHVRRQLTAITFALRAYHVDNGKYPESLRQLKPKYMATIPKDFFSGKPLNYKSQGNAFQLYSVGSNEIDDGGKTYQYTVFGTATGTDDLVVISPGWSD